MITSYCLPLLASSGLPLITKTIDTESYMYMQALAIESFCQEYLSLWQDRKDLMDENFCWITSHLFAQQ